MRVRILRLLVRRGIVETDSDITWSDTDLGGGQPVLAQLAAAAVSGLPPLVSLTRFSDEANLDQGGMWPKWFALARHTAQLTAVSGFATSRPLGGRGSGAGGTATQGRMIVGYASASRWQVNVIRCLASRGAPTVTVQ